MVIYLIRLVKSHPQRPPVGCEYEVRHFLHAVVGLPCSVVVLDQGPRRQMVVLDLLAALEICAWLLRFSWPTPATSTREMTRRMVLDRTFGVVWVPADIERSQGRNLNTAHHFWYRSGSFCHGKLDKRCGHDESPAGQRKTTQLGEDLLCQWPA